MIIESNLLRERRLFRDSLGCISCRTGTIQIRAGKTQCCEYVLCVFVSRFRAAVVLKASLSVILEAVKSDTPRMGVDGRESSSPSGVVYRRHIVIMDGGEHYVLVATLE